LPVHQWTLLPKRMNLDLKNARVWRDVCVLTYLDVLVMGGAYDDVHHWDCHGQMVTHLTSPHWVEIIDRSYLGLGGATEWVMTICLMKVRHEEKLRNSNHKSAAGKKARSAEACFHGNNWV